MLLLGNINVYYLCFVCEIKCSSHNFRMYFTLGEQNRLVVACFHIFLDRYLCPTECSAYLSVNIKTNAFADISHKLVPVKHLLIGLYHGHTGVCYMLTHYGLVKLLVA